MAYMKDITGRALDSFEVADAADLGEAGSPPDASTTVKGIVELATNAETIAGTDTVRASTPAGVVAAITANTLADASETVKGKVELATTAETTTGTDTIRATTPAGVKAAIDAATNTVPDATESVKGKVELATSAETVTGTDTVRAAHPAGVKAAILAGVAPDATETVKGKVELATSAETITGTDNTRATTPLGVDAAIDTALTSALGTVSIQGHAHTSSDITNLEQWRIDNKIPKIETYDSSNSETPGALGTGVLWLDLASTPTSSPAITYVTHQMSTTDAATWTFTPENLLNTFTDYDYFVAMVWTAHSTTFPANDADSMTGGGMTWSSIGTPASSASGIITMSCFRTTAGTPSGADLVINATGGTQGVCFEVIAVRDYPYDDTFMSGSGSGSTATLSVTGATANQRIIAGIGWNTGSQTITADPGTPLGGTPDLLMTSPSVKSRCSVVNPAATSIGWTKSGTSQQAYGGILIGTP
jgi:hypothetical protein